MKRRRLASLLCPPLLASAVLVGGLAGSASAQQLPETAMAEALFQQARELVKQGNYADACPKLAESQRLDPKVGTLLNLAVCHEKLGKIATAWAEYTSAAAIAHREAQRERETFAREQIATLEKKLARVILQVSAPEPGLTITLDDQTMSGPALGTPLPIDPGKHKVSAFATGKVRWTKEIDVPAEHAEVLVPIPHLEAAPETPPPSPPPTTPDPPVAPPPVVPPPIVPPPEPTVPKATPPPSNNANLMGVGFGVGGAALVVGVITGAVTLVNAGNIRNACTGTMCPSEQQGAINNANLIANVSNVSFALAAVGVGVGVAGVVLRPSSDGRKTGLTLTPIVGPGGLGLRGTF